MKRTMIALILVTAFVFAFTTTAQATWRGFTPIRTQSEVDAGRPQGFISFDEAQGEMRRNFAADGNFGPDDPGASLQGTAHGGYVTTTTKCAVCHSAHRAPSVVNNADGTLNNAPGFGADGRPLPGEEARLARNQNQSFLTAGADTCAECHVTSGAQTSRLLVEWGSDGGGPHAAPRRGCTMCHNAGIHGLASSDFNVMNVYMLGNTRRGGEAFCDGHVNGACPVPGCANPTGTNPGAAPPNPDQLTRDEQIRAEMHLWLGPDSQGNVTLQVPGEPDATASNTWWYDGPRELGPIGGVPPSLDIDYAGRQSFAAARSMATAYTCGEAGCHTTGTFFTLNWGVGFNRADSVRTSDDGMNRTGSIMSTGHVLPSVRQRGAEWAACGPCHAGNPAGFPTASTHLGVYDPSRRAWGCDQCHDMVGVATNSTAWPHGNRNISVYEWQADGTQVETVMTSGNLWMYGGNIARAAGMTDVDGNPITGEIHFFNLDAAGTRSISFRGPTSENQTFADQSWLVLTNVTSGRYGVPSNEDDTRVADMGTGLVDGTCLKCHVAIDPASMDAMGSVAADALRHYWNQGTLENPTWDGLNVDGSQRLFLYR